jgi:polyisoprenoid-binding protein YceI
MKSPFRVLGVALVALALATSVAMAAPESFKIDPNHTSVGFSIRHFFSKVQGRFKEFEGTVQLDTKNVPASSVEVTIQAASITTENDRRDADLRSPNFFEVDKNPTLTFKSTKVTLDAGKTALAPGDHFKIDGDLSMHGVTKPVTLDATFLGAGAVGIGGSAMGTRAGFEATTTINRQDWGLNWNKTLDQGGTLLGDEVTISLNVEAGTAPAPRPADAKPGAPKTTDAKAPPKSGGGN